MVSYRYIVWKDLQYAGNIKYWIVFLTLPYFGGRLQPPTVIPYLYDYITACFSPQLSCSAYVTLCRHFTNLLFAENLFINFMLQISMLEVDIRLEVYINGP